MNTLRDAWAHLGTHECTQSISVRFVEMLKADAGNLLQQVVIRVDTRSGGQR